MHTLGCPKNDVDSRTLAYALRGRGAALAARPEDADVIILNTCGFIREATEESLAAIMEAAHAYPRARLVVMGCLVERYREALRSDIPEVAAWFGAEGLEQVAAWVMPGAEPAVAAAVIPSSGGAWGYVKVSDGCDHLCSFCSIPLIKGPYHSLPLDRVLQQADEALAAGARELVLVGQDTALWKEGGRGPVELVEELAGDPRVVWLRFMYLQPEHTGPQLLDLIAHHPKVCHYLDLPFQHAARSVLRRMGRSGDTARHLELIARARTLMPQASLRSTFIVGFPGETEEDFEELLTFVRRARFDHAGCFVFSPEEGTEAFAFKPRVAARVARSRLARLSGLLLDLGEANAGALVGSRVEVLIDGLPGEDCPPDAVAVGRTYRQAPEVDGVTYVTQAPAEYRRVGALLEAVVVEALGTDLIAEYVRPAEPDGRGSG